MQTRYLATSNHATVLEPDASLLGADAAFALRRPGEVPLSALYEEEARSVAHTVLKRQLEMAAGRDAARAAMLLLGVKPRPILWGRGGTPEWPPTIVDSITHTARICAAVVADARSWTSIGIGAEEEAALPRDLWEHVTTAEERAQLLPLSPREAGERARQLFCAKEAAHKCQYPVTGLLLEFSDLQIRWARTRGAVRWFTARYQRTAAPFERGDRIEGFLTRAGGHVFAIATLPSSASTLMPELFDDAIRRTAC
jgi:4'-phosphopantetheinyl transferase EntD